MKTKIIGGILVMSTILFATSCARGVDDSERFSAGVTNAQLESPQINDQSFSILTNPDGTESIKVTWPVVNGAGGYILNVTCIENPEDETITSENPLVVIQDSIIDGCSVAFTKIEDATYNVMVKTLGNEQLNNAGAIEATTFQYSALVPATTIPAGSDIAEYISANLTNSDKEQGFALEAGQTYTLNGTADFGLNTITLRSTDKNGTRPIVVVGNEGRIMTQGGLKIKFINFDCTSCTQKGLLTLSDNPDPSISIKNLGYQGTSLQSEAYVINNPVIFQECNIKNLPNSIIYGNKKPWSLRDFRIKDCIIQLNNEGSNSFIDLSGASPNNGLIKSLSIEKSTIYNLKENGSGYFIRYSNSSNAQPKKIFGDNDNSATFALRNNTISRVMTSKDFGNNTPNTNTLITILENNIFYDTYRIYKALPTQGERTYTGNIIFGVTKTIDSNDTGGRTDSNGNGIATEQDPQFVGPINIELDLTQINGDVNFTPGSGTNAGDPRWK